MYFHAFYMHFSRSFSQHSCVYRTCYSSLASGETETQREYTTCLSTVRGRLDGVTLEPGPFSCCQTLLPCNLLSICYVPGTELGAQGSEDQGDPVPSH